jgi:hypothetical protein
MEYFEESGIPHFAECITDDVSGIFRLSEDVSCIASGIFQSLKWLKIR